MIASILLFGVSDPRLHRSPSPAAGSATTVPSATSATPPIPTLRRRPGRLQAAAGYIRSLMAKKLSWRVAPELRFYVDTSVDQAEAISQALNSEREHQEKRIEEETIGDDREY
ncbi:MAG: ribosome-binding factor A [Adlercreutzia equolifaciens]